MRQLAALIVLSLTSTCLASTPEDVPASLQEWQGWVLHEVRDHRCRHPYDADSPRICAWPGRLELELGKDGGEFRQDWQVYARTWLPLPGSKRHWPQNLRLNGKAVAVVARRGQPVIGVEPGRHQLSGRFLWDDTPEHLAVPPALGLVHLQLEGREVAFPDVSRRGQLWLRSKVTGGAAEESLDISVFRLIEDDIPQRLTTRIQLQVSGEAREIALPAVLVQGFTATAIDSALPARLEEEGLLRLQLRPGRWQVSIRARSDAPIDPVRLQSHPAPWPQEEVWVFMAHPELRLVEALGLTRVDPRQTGLPGEWQGWPAFRVVPGEGMGFRVIRRGDQDPLDDQLALSRTLWLDFGGRGYTVKDSVTGSIHKTWRLSTEPDVQLGQVVIDGRPQFITSLPGEQRRGVEIRRGELNLQADSRYERDIREIPANGWNQDMQSVQATLQLPPGWRLFSVAGIDNAPRTWLQRWTLLDIFLVLIASIAVARLFGLGWSAMMLAMLALSWHEPMAPQYSWLNLLAAVVLLRILPQGRMRRLANLYRGLSVIVLVLIGLPFIVHEVRTAIYPQLERHAVTYRSVASPAAVSSLPQKSTRESTAPGERAIVADIRKAPPARSKGLDEIDPNALLQTGPGLPEWTWVQIPLRWNGPVQKGQRMRLQLIPPLAVTLLKLLLSALLILLIVRLADVRTASLRLPQATTAMLLLPLLLLLAGMIPTAQAQAQGYPDEALLKELRKRLTAPDDCLPDCAQIARATMKLSDQTLSVELELHTDQAVAIPLPGTPHDWMPATMSLDGRAVGLLYRSDRDVLWFDAPAGVHRLGISGPLPGRVRLPLHFPLVPRYLQLEAKGWEVTGLLEDGGMEANLELLRQRQDTRKEQELQATALPGLVRLERTLHLGLDWQVDNRIVRLTPPDRALLLNIPLLAGEAVTTPGIQVRNGQVQVNLAPDQQHTRWHSRLSKTEQIRLRAADSLRHGQASWIELWSLDASPVWHVQLGGIPVVHQSDDAGRWLPRWHPWPGEEARVIVTRPEGIGGQTLTIDKSGLEIRPGRRATDTRLAFTLRSTQGGQHTLMLPPHSTLLRVAIDGNTHNLGLQDRRLILPVQPGRHDIDVQWRDPAGQSPVFRTPLVDLGVPSVNSRILLQLGQDRWTLFTLGPRLGPAVLFWGVVLVLLVVSIGLGMTRFTPLKSWQWFLLVLGLTQTPVWLGLIFVGWLLLLGARSRLHRRLDPRMYNAMQLGLALLSLIALIALFVAVRQGLLGLPEMQIAGNGSSAGHLRWYQDRSAPMLPQATAVSVPLLAYRLLMLAWALWLAFALLGWLRWGWTVISEHGLWHHVPARKRGPSRASTTAGTSHENDIPKPD